MKRTLTVAMVALCLATLGCGDDTRVEVKISPTVVMTTAGGTTRFEGIQTTSTARHINISNDSTQFDWAVVEPAGGTIAPSPGAPSAAHVYTAPVGPGVFHVKITSHMDSSATATATVTVVSP